LLVRQCCRSASQVARWELASCSCAASGPLYCWHVTSSLLRSVAAPAASGVQTHSGTSFLDSRATKGTAVAGKRVQV